MKTALLSVYNKDGIAEFAKQIQDLGFKIYASGGTAKALKQADVEALDVADLVGGEAILGHRVVTLSREIYAGLLSRDTEEDRVELERLKIPRIDLVCVDLYPLEETITAVSSQGQEQSASPYPSVATEQAADKDEAALAADLEQVLEKTDIGGPTLLRAAAKGRRIVITEASDRQKVIEWLKNGQPEKEQFLSTLAAKAEFTVAKYALMSARYHGRGAYEGLFGYLISECKYGENAWQKQTGLFSSLILDPLSLTNFRLIAGTAPSYNNWCDADRLLQTMTHIAAGFDVNFGQVPKIAVGVKHGNACGASVADDPTLAIQKMLEGDLRAIFGGVVMVNFEVDEKLAEILLTHKMSLATGRDGSQSAPTAPRLFDGIIAPSFTPSAIELLKRKGDKCRFLVNPALSSLSKKSLDEHPRFRYVRGGFLKQPNYTFILDFRLNDLEIAGNHLSDHQKSDIILAWAVGSTSNSNTVTIVKDGMLLGNGVGQQDRVGGCELAIKRATDAYHNLKNATAYSDSFFPFPDGPLKLIEAGIQTIFGTRGSVNDEETKKICARNGVILITLPDSKARGFFGH